MHYTKTVTYKERKHSVQAIYGYGRSLIEVTEP
jgi:hypothetical protein